MGVILCFFPISFLLGAAIGFLIAVIFRKPKTPWAIGGAVIGAMIAIFVVIDVIASINSYYVEARTIFIPNHYTAEQKGAPTEIRTPVLALKGLRPGPLDDGGLY